MTSFNKASTTVGDAVPATTSSTEIVTAPVPMKIGGISGPTSRSDIVHPTINIVHAVGPLSEEFTPGQIVLNREFVIAEAEKPVKLTVLHFNKFFLENVPYGGEAQAREFHGTAAEADLTKAGLHTNWVNNTKPPASAAADALVAVESDTENPLFPFSYNGKYYAIAKWRLTGGAYNRAGKLIVTAAEWSLKDGLHNGSWALSTRREKIGVNWVWLPVLKAGPRNAVDLAEFFTKLV